MSDLQFNEEVTMNYGTQMSKKPSAIISFVLRTGIVKNSKGAEHVLIGFVIVAIIVATILFWIASTPPAPPQIPDEVLMEMM